jgi:thiol-disulfide isomerase/thioredoxin
MNKTRLEFSIFMVLSSKMKPVAFLLGFLMGLSLAVHGQDWVIQGTIENAEPGQVLLASYYGDRFSVADSMESSSGFFYFMLPEASPPGIYRIIFTDRSQGIRNQNRFVEFIFNRENLDLVISPADRGPVAYFGNSIENQVYSGFMEYELNYEEELMSVYRQLYPGRGGTDPQLVARYEAIQLEREQYIDSVSSRFPALYAVRIMNAFRAPFIPGFLSHLERVDTLKECFFNQAAIDDPQLLHAPVYPFKLIDYLSLYQVDTLSKEEQEAAFMEAVDRIMVNVSSEGDLRSFVVEFLMAGFEMLDMEQVQVYIADNYLDETCQSDIVDLVLSRMEGYKRMTPGTLAPDFVIRDLEGVNYQLSELGHAYVLLLFWSSTCEGCQKLLPQLKEWYETENSYDLEVVAISMDTTETYFQIMYDRIRPPWITAREPLGWLGKVPSDYFVYATPTMYLLDRNRMILSRPAGLRQLQRALRKLED